MYGVYIFFREEEIENLSRNLKKLIKSFECKKINVQIRPSEELNFMKMHFHISCDSLDLYILSLENIACIALFYRDIHKKELYKGKQKEKIENFINETKNIIDIIVTKYLLINKLKKDDVESYIELERGSVGFKDDLIIFEQKKDDFEKCLKDEVPYLISHLIRVESTKKLLESMIYSVKEENLNAAKIIDNIKDFEHEESINNLFHVYRTLSLNYSLLRKYISFLSEEIIHLENFLKNRAKSNSFLRKMDGYKTFLNMLKDELARIEIDLDRAKKLIDIIQTKTNLELNKEILKLQKRGYTFRVAASFIEFVVVFYYTLAAWKTISKNFVYIPTAVKLFLVGMLSVSIVFITHHIAQYISEKKLEKSIYFFIAVVVLSFAGMILSGIAYTK